MKGLGGPRLMTPVIFKKDRDGCNVFAAFPTIPGDMSPFNLAVYAHVGQHSSAGESYVSLCKAAKPDEYAALLQELRSIGYDDLVIRKRLTRSDYEARKQALARDESALEDFNYVGSRHHY